MNTKKYLFFAVACMAALACGKMEINNTEPDMPVGESFVAGEKVTLFASAKEESKVSSAYIGGTINFKWEEGDKILVTVGTKSSEFTLTDGAGTASGRFVGEMPAAGNNFKVQYPVTDPDLSSQALSENEPLPEDKMKFTGVGALDEKKTSNFVLTPAYSALKLKLYGADVTVKSIKLSLNSKNYTLSCGEGGVALESEESGAKQFIIVVPPVENKAFSVVVDADYTNTDWQKEENEYPGFGSGKPITKRYFASDAKTFTANKVKNLSAVELTTTIWSPVNCGYDATDSKYGKYYQFGRYVGGAYDQTDKGYSQASKKIEAKTVWNKTTKIFSNPANDTFYTDTDITTGDKPTGTLGDWYTGTTSKQLKKWPHSSTDEGYVAGKICDPCPEGWRLPTAKEMNDLIGGFTKATKGVITYDGTHGSSKNIYGCFYDGTPNPVRNGERSLFLPSSAYISCGGGNQNYDRKESLNYWTSDVSGTKGCALQLRIPLESGSTASSHIAHHNRAYGFAIRCVKE